MGRAKEIIDKYGLRDNCSVRGVFGQKMDEDCIQAFIEGDPSGNCKYLEWMIFQAGGGKERHDKSLLQWDKGDHGENPIRDTLRKNYIEDAVKGYKDDDGKWVAPVTEEVAIQMWEAKDEEKFKLQHIYGDEEYTLTGFGFYRSWPGNNSLYEHIVQTVQRFHRYQQKLRSLGKSIDLNVANYPNLRDLQEVLADITMLEIRNNLVYDTVYDDENLVVIAPLNIGASIKFGHQKWCSANESMFKTAISGGGPNRWKEYAKDSALYYCRFKKRFPGDVLVNQIAIQAPYKNTSKDVSWKFYDTADTAHSDHQVVNMVESGLDRASAAAWKRALLDVSAHHRNYPRAKLNLELVVKP